MTARLKFIFFSQVAQSPSKFLKTDHTPVVGALSYIRAKTVWRCGLRATARCCVCHHMSRQPHRHESVRVFWVQKIMERLPFKRTDDAAFCWSVLAMLMAFVSFDLMRSGWVEIRRVLRSATVQTEATETESMGRSTVFSSADQVQDGSDTYQNAIESILLPYQSREDHMSSRSGGESESESSAWEMPSPGGQHSRRIKPKKGVAK